LGEANVLQAMGDVQAFRKENDTALDSYAQALTLFRAVGARLGEANVLAALSRIAVAEGRLDEAEAQLAKIIETRRAIGSLYNEGADYGNFAIVLLNNGYPQKAGQYARLARDIFAQIDLPALVEMMGRIVILSEQQGGGGVTVV
jgi:tetratricopeptide (TPR) repeat protein